MNSNQGRQNRRSRPFNIKKEEERPLLEAFVGSQNQDYRGIFMDGEVAMVFSGAEALVPLVDLLFLEGTVTWLYNRATLDRLLPPPSEYLRRLVRVGKDGL